MLYRTTNNYHNQDYLWMISFFVFPTVVYILVSDLSFLWGVLLFLCELIIAVLLILKFRSSALELNFDKEKIQLLYKFRELKTEFNYNNLVEVHYRKPYRGKGSNIFVFNKNGEYYKVTTDIIEHGESYVNFIKFLKEKNDRFKTYVAPDGNAMQSRLRQEILGEEY